MEAKKTKTLTEFRLQYGYDPVFFDKEGETVEILWEAEDSGGFARDIQGYEFPFLSKSIKPINHKEEYPRAKWWVSRVKRKLRRNFLSPEIKDFIQTIAGALALVVFLYMLG